MLRILPLLLVLLISVPCLAQTDGDPVAGSFLLVKSNPVTQNDSAKFLALHPNLALTLQSSRDDSLRTVFTPFSPSVMLVQLYGGVIGFLAVGISAGYAAKGVLALDGESNSENERTSTLIGYACGTLIGLPLGVDVVGDGMGGNGSFRTSMAGAAAGALVGWMLDDQFDSYSWKGVGLAIYSHILGTIIGYHLSSTRVFEDPLTWPDPLTTNRSIDPTRPAPDMQMTITLLRF